MTLPKIVGSQRDFSAGEVDPSLKRGDESPIMKAGARQMSNWRITNAKSVKNRPGRSALFLETGRTEEVLMAPGMIFKIVFGAGTLRVYDSTGTQVFAAAGFLWTLATVKSIVWDIYLKSIYIAFPGQIPKVLSWDGVATWSVINYAETVDGSGKKLTPFYRISPHGITLTASGFSGAITVTASAALFTAGWVGRRIRLLNHQILITAYTDPTHVNATVQEHLPLCETFIPNAMIGTFSVGDIVANISNVGATGLKAEVAAVVYTAGVPTLVSINMLQGGAVFNSGDECVGPNGSCQVQGATSFVGPFATNIWDEEVMNSAQGWPASVFVDQNRVGFCNFPSVPSGIAWSAIGLPNDLYVDSLNVTGDDAIFELAPNKSQVFFVMAGAESSEFVFCDRGIYYIPITVTNPLKPGSVAFNLLSGDGCAKVQPRVIQEVIVWINAGLTSILAITAPGAYYRPYQVQNLSDFHAHLIKSPIAIAAPSSTDQFEERYAYVLNGDGTMAVGKYNASDGQIKGVVGWLPWSGAGSVTWVSALGSDVIMTTSYAIAGAATVSVVEQIDANQYLDSAISVNAPPSGIPTPGGKGPLWWLAGGTVQLMDNFTRMMGTYTIDANGFIIPQNNGGENLLSAQLVAGQMWTAVLEPFVPDANPGQSMHQRMFKRRVSRMAVYVINSTGFLLARLFSGPLTPTSPPLGTIMNSRRIPTWNQGDDPTQPPPLRETTERWRPLGRAFDPRVAVIKDTPGPLEIPELGLEATI